jgi:hypothetical protein
VPAGMQKKSAGKSGSGGSRGGKRRRRCRGAHGGRAGDGARAGGDGGAADPQDCTKVFPTGILRSLAFLIHARTPSRDEETKFCFFLLFLRCHVTELICRLIY